MATKYYLTEYEIKRIQKRTNEVLSDLENEYKKHPEYYGKKTVTELKPNWQTIALNTAIFEQIKYDGLADITKEYDEHYTFADHEGDCFNPVVNTDIDPEQLKKARRKEQRRFSNEGVYYHSLTVDGVENIDSIGGFVGNDFYGSGYDLDFYQTAIDIISEKYPDYLEQVQS